jgi:hypothetical protein
MHLWHQEERAQQFEGVAPPPSASRLLHATDGVFLTGASALCCVLGPPQEYRLSFPNTQERALFQVRLASGSGSRLHRPVRLERPVLLDCKVVDGELDTQQCLLGGQSSPVGGAVL